MVRSGRAPYLDVYRLFLAISPDHEILHMVNATVQYVQNHSEIARRYPCHAQCSMEGRVHLLVLLEMAFVNESGLASQI